LYPASQRESKQANPGQIMETKRQADGEQSVIWNGAAGRAWVDERALLDGMFRPFQEMLVEGAEAAGARRVLDVGCGTGGTTLALARRLGPESRCTGIDLSVPMIEAACEHARREGLPATFVVADAQEHAFPPGGFDRIVSRFGVMFFDDPVRAFANLRRAAAADAGLQLIVWRGAAENPFMTTAERAAAPLLAELTPRRDGAPGQFAFADRGRVASILEGSGWSAIDLRPVDVVCTFPEAKLTDYVTRLGPVGRILDGVDDATRGKVLETVRRAFEPFVQGAEVRYHAAGWEVTARS
jgi:SAM-dependent methyltransferase